MRNMNRSEDTRDMVRQVAVWIAVVATIVENALANILPINGVGTGTVANQFLGQNLWLPAGYVFSIWGLIYIGLIAYAIYQSLPAQRTNPRLRATGWPFVISCVANMAWLLFFHYSYEGGQQPNVGLLVASMIAMLVLLGALVAIYLQLRRGAPPVSNGERWAVRLPFSIYLGWITVATVANAAQVLVAAGWTGQPLPALVWLIIMFLVALALAALMAVMRRDTGYLLVLVWAFVGIAVNYSGMIGVLISSAVAALAVLALALLVAARAAWQGRAYTA